MNIRHKIEDEYEKPAPNRHPKEHLTPALCCRHVFPTQSRRTPSLSRGSLAKQRNRSKRPRKANDTGEEAAAALHMQLRRAVAKQTIPP